MPWPKWSMEWSREQTGSVARSRTCGIRLTINDKADRLRSEQDKLAEIIDFKFVLCIDD